MLKIGELARRTGLTVRALRHYDDIGLLRPSARSEAGYRLYDRDDLARLHRILTLRRFGMALGDIEAYLDSSAGASLALLDRQIAALGDQIEQARRARIQLEAMRELLVRGESPDLSAWLTTLEMMHMYEKYFTETELEQLPVYRDQDARADWRALAADAAALMASGARPEDRAVRPLAERWLTLLERDSAGNPEWQMLLDAMHEQEPAVQREFGVTPAIKDFMLQAIGALKMDLYARYLPPQAMEHMRRHAAGRMREWPALIARMREQMRADPGASSPASHTLGLAWRDLFVDMIGPDPAAIPHFRQAIDSEPLLQVGRGMSEEMLAWLRQVPFEAAN